MPRIRSFFLKLAVFLFGAVSVFANRVTTDIPGKSYVAQDAEARTFDFVGLFLTVPLARGGSITYGYSDNGAKDLASIVYPATASNGVSFPAVAESFIHGVSGRVNAISDRSGTRVLGYIAGTLNASNYTAGPLSGYRVVNTIDSHTGRKTGFGLYDPKNTLIHSAGYTFTGDSGESDEIATITSGDHGIVIQHDAAHRITGFQHGDASGTVFTPTVTQTWGRSSTGRITSASNNVASALSYTYDNA